MKIKSIEIEWEDGQRTVFTSPLLGRIELDASEVKPHCGTCNGTGYIAAAETCCGCSLGGALRRLMDRKPRGLDTLQV